MGKRFIGGLGLWLAAGMACAQNTLTLQDYLGEVRSRGADYRALKAAAEGYEKQSHQQDLVYSPVLTSSYSHLDDRSQQSTVLATDQTLADAAGVSIVDKLPFGPTLAVGYSFNDIHLKYSPELLSYFGGSSSAFLSSYYQVSPVVSLSVPLFKDFGGAQTGAGVKAVQYGMESAQKLSAYQREGVLFNAKVAYWSLALARSEVAIRRDTLARSRKTLQWTRRRVARNLADPPDALQAQASEKQAELDLETALNGERSARLAFNRYRGQSSEAVPESLQTLEDSLAGEKVDFPAALPERLDLQAMDAQARQKKAAYDQTYQNVYPDITALASWRGNGLDPDLSAANHLAFGTDHPTWMLGAQFTLPLDVFTASRTAEGYKKEYESSVLGLEDKQLAVAQDWRDIRDRLADVDKRLALAAEIESLQRRNADEEKRELDLGRTTQFQLLSFENQYSLARLSRLSIIAEKLSLLARAQWWLTAK